MNNSIVVYDQTLRTKQLPTIRLEKACMPTQVCVARDTVGYDNGCYVRLILGVHWSLSKDCSTIRFKMCPDGKICKMLGLRNRYIIVVENNLI